MTIRKLTNRKTRRKRRNHKKRGGSLSLNDNSLSLNGRPNEVMNRTNSIPILDVDKKIIDSFLDVYIKFLGVIIKDNKRFSFLNFKYKQTDISDEKYGGCIKIFLASCLLTTIYHTILKNEINLKYFLQRINDLATEYKGSIKYDNKDNGSLYNNSFIERYFEGELLGLFDNIFNTRLYGLSIFGVKPASDMRFNFEKNDYDLFINICQSKIPKWVKGIGIPIERLNPYFMEKLRYSSKSEKWVIASWLQKLLELLYFRSDCEIFHTMRSVFNTMRSVFNKTTKQHNTNIELFNEAIELANRAQFSKDLEKTIFFYEPVYSYVIYKEKYYPRLALLFLEDNQTFIENIAKNYIYDDDSYYICKSLKSEILLKIFIENVFEIMKNNFKTILDKIINKSLTTYTRGSSKYNHFYYLDITILKKILSMMINIFKLLKTMIVGSNGKVKSILIQHYNDNIDVGLFRTFKTFEGLLRDTPQRINKKEQEDLHDRINNILKNREIIKFVEKMADAIEVDDTNQIITFYGEKLTDTLKIEYETNTNSQPPEYINFVNNLKGIKSG